MMLKYLFFVLLCQLALTATPLQDEAHTELTCFVDVNKTYTVEEVIAQKELLFSKKLLNSNSKFPANSVVWIKAELNNKRDTAVEKVIKFLDIRLDRVDVYSEKGQWLYSMGDRIPFVERTYADAQIAIDISSEAHHKKSLYFRFSNEDKMDLTYTVYEKTAYIKELVFKKEMHAFFFGALVIMLIYNIILFLFIREKTFFIYILYHSTVLVVMLYYNGIISQYYHPDSFDVNGGNVPTVLSYLSIVLAIEFLRYFLNVKEQTPKMDRWLRFFVYLNIVLMILSPVMILSKHIPIANMMFLSLFLLYVSGYHAFYLKNKIALFYLFGWIVMLVAIIITGLLSFGYVERNDFTNYLFQIGIVIEITLLSMGLAYRYKINQDELREKTQVLHEQSKLASMGEMMRHIAHQWRQPLSEINSVAMKIESEHRRKSTSDSSLDKNIEQIETLTEHMSKTIQDFNGYFKSDKQKVKVEPGKVVDKALDLIGSGLTKSDIKIEKNIETYEKVTVVEGELIQVLLVLLNNARDALKSSDTSERWIKIRVAKEGETNVIEVEDSAGGIEQKNLAKVFEPYFTTKFESQGVGIGLYMSKMIVEESLKGSLDVSNTADGAKFTIVF